MANVAAHALMVGMCVLLSLQTSADMPALTVVGMLVAVCLAALASFVPGTTWLTLCGAFSVVCAALPAWAVFLPVVACDATYLIPFTDRLRDRRAKIALAVVPVAAACVAALRQLRTHAEAWPLDAPALAYLLLVPFTALTGIAGWVRANGLRAQMRYQTLADAQRERLRLSHARIADVEASRAVDMRRARLNERTRIAREIHDNVGHVLTRAIMVTQADQVVAATVGDRAHAEQFERIGDVLDEAMTMIRRSVHDLKDEGTDFHGMMEDASAVTGGAAIAVRLEDGIGQAPSAVAHCFAAVIREALTNTIRHGRANEATVRLIDLPGLWQLVVQDDGGAPGETAHAGGIGLADIEERARALGGNATCGPYGEGWRVFVSVPKPEPAPHRNEGA